MEDSVRSAAVARSLEAGARALSAAGARLELRAQGALENQRARDQTLEEVDRLRAKLALLNAHAGAPLEQKRVRVEEEQRQQVVPLAQTTGAANMAALAGVLAVDPDISYEDALLAVERAAQASPRRARSLRTLGAPQPGAQRWLRAAPDEFTRGLASVLLEPSQVKVRARATADDNQSQATFAARRPHDGASFRPPPRCADGAPSSIDSLLAAAPSTTCTEALAIVRRRDDVAEAEEREFQVAMAVAAQQLDDEEAAVRAATRAERERVLDVEESAMRAVLRTEREQHLDAEEAAMRVHERQLDAEEAARRAAMRAACERQLDAVEAAARAEKRNERPLDRDPTWMSTRPVLPWVLQQKSSEEEGHFVPRTVRVGHLRKNDRVLQRVFSRTNVEQSTFHDDPAETSPARITNVGHRHRDEARLIIASLRATRAEVSDNDGRRAARLAEEWRRRDAVKVASAAAEEMRSERRGGVHVSLQKKTQKEMKKKKKKKKRGLPPPPPPT